MSGPGDGATAREIRARVDAMAPRVLPDGQINAQHVAIEQTLRERHALPSYIAELDGPGCFRPVVADTTAGEAEREALLSVLVRAGVWPLAVAETAADALAARSGGAQDDGLRARIEALAEEFDRRDAEIPAPFARYDLGYGDAMVFAADRLRRALAGPDDARQDGAR